MRDEAWMPLPGLSLTAPLTVRTRGGMATARTSFDARVFRASCPEAPGVYAMRDEHGSIIYVGKSRKLRDRLKSHLRAVEPGEKSWRILQSARTLTWEELPDEFGSMLREIELIQTLKPRYNVQYNPARKKRGYVYLTSGETPRFAVSADLPEQGEALGVVGPLPSRRRLSRVVELLNDHFGLASCNAHQKMTFADDGATLAGPDPTLRPGCLRVLVNECAGPCVRACTRAGYEARVEAAKGFLLGKDLSPVRAAETTMAASAEALEFERAAMYRDRWLLLRWAARRMRDLRRARRGFHFVYCVQETWYLIRGGLVVAVAPEPQDEAERTAMAARIEALLMGPKVRHAWPDALAGENLALVMRWFRERPEEKAQLVEPAEMVRQLCQF